MTWRELVGWSLVVAGSACGIAASAMKRDTCEAFTVAGAAFMGAAAAWGYTSKPKA